MCLQQEFMLHVFAAIVHVACVCSKEAQKCCCGSANCRGFIGGTKTKSLRSSEVSRSSKPSSSTPKAKKEKRMKEFDDLIVSSWWDTEARQ